MGPKLIRNYCETMRIAIEVGDATMITELDEIENLTNEDKAELWGKLRSYERSMIKTLIKAHEENSEYVFHGWMT